ncbi:drug resistance transporter, EmrB/QacA subfamily [Catenulispora acidiphila DSM 44928]|uniref:Drug resistance transporter, EmrB/QacA subfamily n=1 Tax=Catenulispora acidiphila (strain DSM 44928 / JCM 14897 / NBRC 102108 / NRRL B-24433 / ID139908) TaxID=479433 RepID=C7PZI4_CATAD|nr:MFS transporter [Catenulispora acidiphila]ACU71641.1 drug resistance transporter, EmrB/QacA subfamily [Catenulispora acidiphila DSM 44928]
MTQSYERAAPPDDGPADPNRWRALTVCLVAGFMTLLDVSIVNVGLPQMEAGLRASPADVSWVRAGYTLTFGLVLVPSGKLGDALGRKRVFLLGLFLFTGVSLMCALSPTAQWLVVARLLQGVAGGLLNPQIIAMIQQLFRGSERGKAFGLYGGTVAVATAIGPLAGGLLIEAGGWRWMFLINLPIGVVGLVLGVLLVPKIPPRRRGRGMDLVGVALLGGGITSIMLPLIEQEQGGAAVHWWLLGLAAVLLVAFVFWERWWKGRGLDPLVNLSLLRTPSFGASSLVGLAYFAGYPGVLFILSLYLQQGRAYSALAAGATSMPFAVGSAISAAVSGRAVYRIGRVLVVAGLVAVLAGLIPAAVIIQHDTGGAVWARLFLPLLVAGLGSGLVIGPNQTLALQFVPPASSGTAAAMVQTGQRIGMSVGTAMAATMFFGHLKVLRHDYSGAASRSLYGAAALVTVALAAASVDLAAARRLRRRPATGQAAEVPGSRTGSAVVKRS